MHHTHRISHHCVTWLAVVVVVLSGASITLAATAQTTIASICDRNTAAGFGCTTRRIDNSTAFLEQKIDRALAKVVLCIQTDPDCPYAINQAPGSLAQETGGPAPRGESEAPATPPATTPSNALQAPPAPAPEPTPPPPTPSKSVAPPPPSPQDPQKYQTCVQQCKDAFATCAAATKETPVTTGYSGDDPICVWNRDKECLPLCNDWYNSPVVTKPPVPPIESSAQTCLLDCRTQMAACFKAAKIKYQVTNPNVIPPQAYFDELKLCITTKDNSCRAVCRAWNPNSTAPTQ